MNLIGKLFISPHLRDSLEIPIQSEINVRVGSLIVRTRLIIREGNKKSYMLSPELNKALLLKTRKKYKIRYDHQNNIVHIGPTIGILAISLPNKNEFDPKGVQAELIYLSNIAKNYLGQVYIFTPNSIDWSSKTTKGYVYKYIRPHYGVWTSARYPLPDVVYDRITTRRSESKTSIQKTKDNLMSLPYLKYFNPSFLDKWKVHQVLDSNPQLNDYLPETYSFSKENIESMIQKYSTLYLKPIHGSLGKGIIKLTKDKSGKLHYIIHRTGRIRGKADNIEEFIKKTKKSHGNRPYIVQQGINLAKYKGAPFDIRIIFQKNSKGNWQISKKFARVAPRGSSISNLSSGGKVQTTKKTFRYLFNKKDTIEARNKEIKNMCLKIAKTIENSYDGTFGELGLDIGIDIKGHPWLIEVNSKPRKTTETVFSKIIVKNTFKRPIEFSIYLAGFCK
ncbi:hypothetical protein SYNTR_0727 [Candidatus Syntrophocurvum alkaliphilum]|uniref:ATP-grasp domain-containing protein n=1 Tax=Candidatus Syntrophocurvum alkaliphilum TaxID=2293317 RepID=A0A6I6DFX0_9FIRM|nr:YheC/YheD family protein [Candidatus Syntrophocurvum alkaliphilum]QGT99320.1 hypothetical protein SYNTR_0727 [Candidatus Syntrophocurvum alkaliphilum]